MSTTMDPNDFNRNLIAEFRENDGKVTGMFADRPLMLLTTTGARSGQPRTVPLVHTRDRDRLVAIASNGGAPTNPDWYHNLVAHPTVTIELPGETFEAKARVPQGAERDRLFAAQAALMPGFAEYETKTTRKLPVVIFERAS